MKKTLDASKLLQGEIWVAKEIRERLGWPITEDKVTEVLGLDIKRQVLGARIEAQLCPASSATNFNGQIIINSMYEEDSVFDYMHEVVHYIHDVGVGNKVDHNFTRKHENNRIDETERQIDFLTAVSLIPIDELAKDIDYYNKHWYILNEARYTRKLLQKYKCSKECLMQRYSEVHTVRRILKNSNLSSFSSISLQTALDSLN